MLYSIKRIITLISKCLTMEEYDQVIVTSIHDKSTNRSNKVVTRKPTHRSTADAVGILLANPRTAPSFRKYGMHSK